MATPINKEAQSDVIINGYLEKRSLHVKKYRNRWIVLKTNGCLHAFKNKKDFDDTIETNNENETEIIDLQKFNFIITSDNTNKFEFLSKDKKINKRAFKASNIQMKNKWIKYIKLKHKHLMQMQNKNDSIKINICINNDGFGNERFKSNFLIYSVYSKDETMKNIFNPITKYLSEKYHPLSVKIDYIKSDSFTGYITGKELINLSDKPLTDYDKNDIVNCGIDAVVLIHRQHKINSLQITCVHMNEIHSTNAMDCPIYFTMKQNCHFKAENLAHLNEYNHFMDEYNEKPICRKANKCTPFVRLENGIGGHMTQLKDECHMKLYRHPPRKRHTKLSHNINALILNKKQIAHQVVPLYIPTDMDDHKYDCDEWDGYLNALIEEVILNGYQYDLCLECTMINNECKHNIYDDKYSILTIVDEKIESHRHKTIGQPLRRDHMLSLILYTCCECSYDLCTSQSMRNYDKWKWFDYCLCNAIHELSKRESGLFTVYTAFNRVRLDKKSVDYACFSTYVSCTWNRQIANGFINDSGMIIEMDTHFKNSAVVQCCDVSWLSRFPDESVVLCSRSTLQEKFKCVVLNESNGIQTVSLKT